VYGLKFQNFKMASGLTIPTISVPSSPLGLDDNDNDNGSEWTVNDGLRVYFITIRLRVDMSHECCSYIMKMLQKHKLMEQMLLCLEKENAAGPCTHHLHSLVHFKQNIPKPTLKQLLDRWVLKFYKKDEGLIKHDYATKAAIDVRTCLKNKNKPGLMTVALLNNLREIWFQCNSWNTLQHTATRCNTLQNTHANLERRQ